MLHLHRYVFASSRSSGGRGPYASSSPVRVRFKSLVWRAGAVCFIFTGTCSLQVARLAGGGRMLHLHRYVFASSRSSGGRGPYLHQLFASSSLHLHCTCSLQVARLAGGGRMLHLHRYVFASSRSSGGRGPYASSSPVRVRFKSLVWRAGAVCFIFTGTCSLQVARLAGGGRMLHLHRYVFTSSRSSGGRGPYASSSPVRVRFKSLVWRAGAVCFIFTGTCSLQVARLAGGGRMLHLHRYVFASSRSSGGRGPYALSSPVRVRFKSLVWRAGAVCFIFTGTCSLQVARLAGGGRMLHLHRYVFASSRSSGGRGPYASSSPVRVRFKSLVWRAGAVCFIFTGTCSLQVARLAGGGHMLHLHRYVFASSRWSGGRGPYALSSPVRVRFKSLVWRAGAVCFIFTGTCSLQVARLAGGGRMLHLHRYVFASSRSSGGRGPHASSSPVRVRFKSLVWRAGAACFIFTGTCSLQVARLAGGGRMLHLHRYVFASSRSSGGRGPYASSSPVRVRFKSLVWRAGAVCFIFTGTCSLQVARLAGGGRMLHLHRYVFTSSRSSGGRGPHA